MSDHASPPDSSSYDELAAVYARANEDGLFNAWYERPEVLRLAGDVRGKRVLDAGCGHGPISLELSQRGAQVSAFDLSPSMIALARKRLGGQANLRVADLSEPLPYANDDFDLIVCSLALHYVEDWAPTLAEMRRVLRPGGRLIVSIIHPFVYSHTYPHADYFQLTRYSEDYDFDGTAFAMSYWHRPLQDVIGAFLASGFSITTVSEPPVHPDTPTELLPGGKRRFISFLFFALQSP